MAAANGDQNIQVQFANRTEVFRYDEPCLFHTVSLVFSNNVLEYLVDSVLVDVRPMDSLSSFPSVGVVSVGAAVDTSNAFSVSWPI